MNKINISKDEVATICRAFHKWFRVADCKNNADVDMWKAINKLSEEEYHEAFVDSLSEVGIIEEEKKLRCHRK